MQYWIQSFNQTYINYGHKNNNFIMSIKLIESKDLKTLYEKYQAISEKFNNIAPKKNSSLLVNYLIQILIWKLL